MVRTRHWLVFGLFLFCFGGMATAASMSESEARRFLSQATFGPTEASTSEVMASGRAAWLQKQFTIAVTDYKGFSYIDPSPKVGCPVGAVATCGRDNYSLFPLQVEFFQHALTAEDQLRQRVALALSEILVTSGQRIRQPYAMANYQRIFLSNAFGNFKDVFHAVTLSPAMGNFLNMVNNDKPDPVRGTVPNENYAREVLQLFSIGLWQLNVDGSLKLDSSSAPIPTYNQDTVEGFAHIFTGWTYPPRAGATSKFPNPENYNAQMVGFEAHHDTGFKLLLNGLIQPSGKSQVADLEAGISSIFNHPNVGPFIGRRLIQQMVTNNPSPAYIARVSAAFNGSTGAPRGDMKATITAVLADPEASQPQKPFAFGNLREPIIQLAHLFRTLGGYSDGVWLVGQANAMGEPVFSPPTVFNFFSPDNPLPNSPMLDGPAFGIYNATTAFAYSGAVSAALSSKGIAADASVPGSTGSRIDFSKWQMLATDSKRLVKEIDRVLFGQRMSPSLGSILQTAAESQPVSNPLGRVYAALYLALISPEYLVEH